MAKPGEVGDVAVETFRVDIHQGKTATVALSQAPSLDSTVVNNTKTLQSAGIGGGNEPTPVLTVHAATGSISITTATAGTLYLNGRMMGRIPVGGATLSSVGVGSRELTMRHAGGHVERKELMVRAGSATNAVISYRLVMPGSRWAEHTLPSWRAWQSVSYGNGTFVAIGNGASGKAFVATSSNGVKWTKYTMPSSRALRSVAYGNGALVAVAFHSNVVAASP